jgi:RimJ/RimL family protein N-acetyltransferase
MKKCVFAETKGVGKERSRIHIQIIRKQLESEDMSIELLKADEKDAAALFAIQRKSFMPLLERYKDYDTNPANEKIDRLILRLNNPNGVFYKIMFNKQLVGAINILWREGTEEYKISPMFILPEYQGMGIAQETLKIVEHYYSEAKSWELATIKEEERNCHLYEKMGYIKTGELRKLNENTTLIFYKKLMEEQAVDHKSEER